MKKVSRRNLLDTIVSVLLLAASLYFLFMSVYYMAYSMPATSIVSLIVGLVLLIAGMHLYTLSRGESLDEEE